jgi:hypothetical protein
MSGEFTKFPIVSAFMAQTMSELGLTVPNAYIGNTDTTVTQLMAFLNACGQDLCTMTDWQMLHKEWTQILAPANLTYALPLDWNGFISGAGWDNTSTFPLIGPLTPQIWRMVKARRMTSNLSIQYRIVGNLMTLLVAPPADTVVFDYYSRGWILNATAGGTYRDNVAADADQILFDGSLLKPMLKYRWRNAKGFDTSAETDEFQAAWDLIVGRDTPAPTLSIGPRACYPFLGYGNIPDTGYGQP